MQAPGHRPPRHGPRTQPPWVDAPWWHVYGAQLLSEALDRRVWVERLAQAWCLVRTAQALTPAERDRQAAMVDQLLGRSFLPTYAERWELEIPWDGTPRCERPRPCACPGCLAPDTPV